MAGYIQASAYAPMRKLGWKRSMRSQPTGIQFLGYPAIRAAKVQRSTEIPQSAIGNFNRPRLVHVQNLNSYSAYARIRLLRYQRDMEKIK